MDKQTIRLLFLAALKAQNISQEMVRQYLNKNYEEDVTGIPADYFYQMMTQKIRRAVEVTHELTQDTHIVTAEEITQIVEEEVKK